MVKVGRDGTLSTVVTGLNQPTSLEFVGRTAYVVTLGGEVWKIPDPSRGRSPGRRPQSSLPFPT